MKSKEVGPEFVKPHGWKWNIQTPYTHNIDDLRTDFTERIPDHFRQGLGITDLPFPPRLVEGITDEDVIYVQQVLRTGHSSIYIILTRIYFFLNNHFIHKSDGARRAKEFIHAMTRNLDEHVPIAPVLLLLGNVYLSEFVHRPEYHEETKRERQNLDWFELRIAKPLQKLQEADEELEDMLPNERHEQQITEVLSDMSKIIDEVRGTFEIRKALRDFIHEDDTPRTRDPFARGDLFYWVFEGIKDLIKEKGGRARCRQRTHRLFNFWEMPTSEEAIKKHKRRHS